MKPNLLLSCKNCGRIRSTEKQIRQSRGLREMFPFIRIQGAGQRNATVKIDTIEYIETIRHNLSTEYA